MEIMQIVLCGLPLYDALKAHNVAIATHTDTVRHFEIQLKINWLESFECHKMEYTGSNHEGDLKNGRYR